MRLEWRLGNISACFAWTDKFCSWIWASCVDAIVDELGSFTLICFSDVSLVWNIVVRSYIYSFLCTLSRLLGHLHVVVVGIKFY